MIAEPMYNEVSDLIHAFDSRYYLARYPDIAESGVDALLHYCTCGWREGRDPSSEFETAYYLASNPDVAEAGINPFWHYVVAGKHEGRISQPKRSALRKQLTATWSEASSKTHSLADAVLGAPRALSSADFVSVLQRASRDREVIFSVSHDDYVLSTGGVQNIINDECAEFSNREQLYVHLCPVKPMMRTLAGSSALADFQFAVRLNGKALGRIDGSAIGKALFELRRAEVRVAWIIHHLLGHSPEVLGELINIWSPIPPIFWAHDYFLICSGYLLMRNGLEYCASPASDSPGCRICAHGAGRREHRERIAKFIEKISPRLVCPSQRALEILLDGSEFKGFPAEVLPPATLIRGARISPPSKNGKLRVAFLGAPQFHKGWFVYQRLAESLKKDMRYRFFQFGVSAAIPSYIENVLVRVSSDQRNAMTQALIANEIDVVIIWSLWPETFCFTVHEAMAAGAFIVYRRNQGHVDVAMDQLAPRGGCGLDDEQILHEYFKSGHVFDEISHAVLSRDLLLPSMGSAELSPLASNLAETA